MGRNRWGVGELGGLSLSEWEIDSLQRFDVLNSHHESMMFDIST